MKIYTNVTQILNRDINKIKSMLYGFDKKYYLIIEDFHQDTDLLLMDYERKSGGYHGDCLYDSLDEKCPHVDKDDESIKSLLTEFKNLSSNELDHLTFEHSHIGNWGSRLLFKTNYDYGYTLVWFDYFNILIDFINFIDNNHNYVILEK